LGNASFAGMENQEIRKRTLPAAESGAIIFSVEIIIFLLR